MNRGAPGVKADKARYPNNRAQGELVTLIAVIAIVGLVLYYLWNYVDLDQTTWIGSLLYGMGRDLTCNNYNNLQNADELKALLYRADAYECGSTSIAKMQTTYIKSSSPPASGAVIECGTNTANDICGDGKSVSVGGKFHSTNYQAFAYVDTKYCTADPTCGHGKDSQHNPWIYVCAPAATAYFTVVAGSAPELDKSVTDGRTFLSSITLKPYLGAKETLRVGRSGVDVVMCVTECTDDKSCAAECAKDTICAKKKKEAS